MTTISDTNVYQASPFVLASSGLSKHLLMLHKDTTGILVSFYLQTYKTIKDVF